MFHRLYSPPEILAMLEASLSTMLEWRTLLAHQLHAAEYLTLYDNLNLIDIIELLQKFIN